MVIEKDGRDLKPL